MFSTEIMSVLPLGPTNLQTSGLFHSPTWQNLVKYNLQPHLLQYLKTYLSLLGGAATISNLNHMSRHLTTAPYKTEN